MRLDQLGSALDSGAVQGVNIITQSGLNRYALQVLPQAGAPFLLSDRQGKPRFWVSLAQLRALLRRYGVAAPGLQVVVAHDEVIGR